MKSHRPVADEPLAELGDKRMPWPIQRYRALTLLEVFDWETFLRLQEAIWEEETAERLDNGETIEPLDAQQGKAEWVRWQSNMITRFRLEALTSTTQ